MKEGGEKDFTMKFIQINLNHSKAATVVLNQKLATEKAGIVLIQEPWIQGGQMKRSGALGALCFQWHTV
jgi:hypothetical protein